jgi:hypothetical protein
MANYQETALTGTSHTRCCEIRIFNPYAATPSIAFVEQRLTALSDSKVITERGDILAPTYDAAKVIPLRDTTTGALTGATTTFGDVYNILYSAYIAEAEARDAESAP